MYKEFQNNKSDIKKQRQENKEEGIENKTFLNLFGNQDRGTTIPNQPISDNDDFNNYDSPVVKRGLRPQRKQQTTNRKLSHI